MLDTPTVDSANNVLETRSPLADPADLSEFEHGLKQFESGRWHEDRWRTFRLLFGVYEQRQAGEHMVRTKIPGGRMDFQQARAIADASRNLSGGDIHFTTRQDVQLYYIRQGALPDVLRTLYDGGVITREASGNTFRNVTACPLAGICPNERVDAGDVAERLSQTWLRDPLTQHMPRKVKTSVSGCERDCGLTRIDDLGFIATRRHGQNGFRVVAGGGLGTHPRNAVEIFDFVEEQDLSVVQETIARIHHRYSNREDKNRSRIKFLVDRFGVDGFRDKVQEAFREVQALARPDEKASSWHPLAWREDAVMETEVTQLQGAIEQHDDRYAVVIKVPLGWINSDRFDKLTTLAERAGASGYVLTRDQNIVVRDVPAKGVVGFQANVATLGFNASGKDHTLDDLITCPGTSTCPIGITASHSLAEDLIASRDEFEGLPKVRLGISGCHNSCSQHHIADIGLHGLAKKVGGKHAPHYRVHLGGADPAGAVSGPVIPASQAKPAIKALLEAMSVGRRAGESVHAWAVRIGKDGVTEIFSALPRPMEGDGINWRIDLGQRATFRPPVTSVGECAAGTMVAEHLDDLAAVARDDVIRAFAAGDIDAGVAASEQALALPGERLLSVAGIDTADAILDAVRQQWSHDEQLMSVLEAAVTAQHAVRMNAGGIHVVVALKAWSDAANRVVEDIFSAVNGYLARGAAE